MNVTLTNVADWTLRIWMGFLTVRYMYFGPREGFILCAFAIIVGFRMVAKAIREKSGWPQKSW